MVITDNTFEPISNKTSEMDDNEGDQEDNRNEVTEEENETTENEEVPDIVNSNMEVNRNKNEDTINDDSDGESQVNTEHETEASQEENESEQSTDENEVVSTTDGAGDTDDDGEREVSHKYNLRGRGNINCKSMHRCGETQLMQIQQKWIKDKLSNGGNTTTNKQTNK